MTPFLTPEHLTDTAIIGGKASGLWLLQRLEAPVPPWVVVPADGAQSLRSLPSHREVLAGHFHDLNHGAGIAVRSSSLLEDQRDASKAGAFATCFCDTADEVPLAFATVLSSAGPSKGPDASMAVILQRRIRPTLSGILFSAHPSHAHPDRAYIEIVEGSLVGLVEGTKTPTALYLNPFSGATLDAAARPAAFTDIVAQSLCAWLLRVERALGCAADIEWALDDDGLWLLQARPVTRLHLDAAFLPAEPATSWFFDQRFGEPIAPVTRSSLLPIIVNVGIEETLATRQGTAGATSIYDYGGQVYIHLAAYQRLLQGVPLRWLTPDLRQLFPNGAAAPQFLPRPGAFVENMKLLWRERKRGLFNLRAWRKFRDELDGALKAIPDVSSADGVEWEGVWHRLDALTIDFLRIHRWSVALADGGYALFRGLTKCLPRWLRDWRVRRLQDTVRLITSDANRARENFTPTGSCADFLPNYGHRSASLDYRTATWGEIWGALDMPALPSCVALAGRAEAPGYLARLLELREEQRFCWEMILARQRRLLLKAGDGLVEKGLLSQRDEIFWMHFDEVVTALKRGVEPDAETLRGRERAHHLYQTVVRPTHLVPQVSGEIPANVGTESGVFQGLGASSGQVTGRARVLNLPCAFPEDFADDTILVLPCLDPGSTAILGQVAGLVIERGGLLSHAAINARECGVPLVIGIPGVVDAIEDGMTLFIDGETGIVKIEE